MISLTLGDATRRSILRAVAALMVALMGLFLLHNYLVYWRGWPEFSAMLGRLSGAGAASPSAILGWAQALGAGSVLLAAAASARLTAWRSLRDDAESYARWSAYLIRAAYWAVLLIGITDMLISFLRVEGFLEAVVGKHLTLQLGRPLFRGAYVHYPLLVAALGIAWFSRSLGFAWLGLAVVMAEFQVVVWRFVFSYEQAFMGDLVRFWYAALFLFASGYTFAHEGHVRVDVLYAAFSRRGRAWANAAGALLLGLPVCWTIMWQGLSGKGASINSPLLGYEISQSGYGMYVKYLMAGFLLVFAVTMALQFIAAFLRSADELLAKTPTPPAPDIAAAKAS